MVSQSLESTQIGISRGTGTGTTLVNEVTGSRFSAGDLTQSCSSTFTLDGLNKALQSLQVDSSPSSELNQALAGWNSQAYLMLNAMGCLADPPLVSVATSSTTIPVVGSVSTGNPQSQVLPYLAMLL